MSALLQEIVVGWSLISLNRMKNWHWRNWFELVGLGFNILVLTITTGGGGCGFEQWGMF